MIKKIAFFDFDKTLTDQDTIILLWKFAMDKNMISKTYYYKMILSGGINYLKKFNFDDFKSSVCQIFHHFSEEDLEEFVDYVYKNHMLKDGLEFLSNLEVDYKMLVSASPINYLKYFNKYLDFDKIIGTKLDIYCNILDGNNKHNLKVKRIKEHLEEENIEIDYENSLAFSDSYNHDRPMLELVKNRFLINSRKKVSGYTNLYWQ
ncbi:HAD family hydrolase [Peptoniphilus obesi]|uniref:HAD family hydrolase n=1 Tax=Peptoniphilus obesi TaxID=1472765 RepID=UPI0004B5E618|nr:HAD family hydrolase [Peptoniphilus obesi]